MAKKVNVLPCIASFFFKVVSLLFLQRTGANSVENLTSLRLSCFPTPASAFSGSIQDIGEDNFVMCNTSCRPTSQKDQHSSELVYCSHSTLWQLQPPKWFLTYLRLGIVLCLCWVNHGPWTSTLALKQEIQKTRVNLSFFFNRQDRNTQNGINAADQQNGKLVTTYDPHMFVLPAWCSLWIAKQWIRCGWAFFFGWWVRWLFLEESTRVVWKSGTKW